MPTSKQQGQDPAVEKPSPKRSVPRRVASVIAILVACVLADVLVTLLLEPYGAHTEVVWSEYRKASDLNTIVVGASSASYDFDPRVLDQELGSASFNLGTPGQSLHNTLAALRQATSDHKLDRAILCLGYETLTGEPIINSSVVFTQAKCLGESPAEALADIADLVFFKSFFPKASSLTCAFPWAYDHVDYTFEAVAQNVSNRLKGDLLAASKQYSDTLDGFWYYETQGYGGVLRTMVPVTEHDKPFANFIGSPFSSVNMESLREICSLCKSEGVALYVVGCPYSFTTLLEYDADYRTNMSEVQRMVEQSGAHYLDMNMIHRDELALDLSSYFDWLHLNAEGAAQTTKAVANLIGRIEKGEDVSGSFYPYTQEGWDAYCAGIDYVDSVEYDYTIDENGDAQIEAQARTGDGVSVLYQLEVLDPATGTWDVVRAYDADPHMSISRGDQNSATIRIYARDASAPKESEPWVEGTVDF